MTVYYLLTLFLKSFSHWIFHFSWKSEIELDCAGRVFEPFFRGGGYKNGVGGRVVEFLHLGA